MTLDEIKPFGDRILVRPDPKHAQTEGGLHIPETVLADNPNYYYVSGVVVKLGDGYYEDVYECLNQQCRYQCRRTVGEYCPVCKATQKIVSVGERLPFDVQVGDRVLFGRFAGKQIEVESPLSATDVREHGEQVLNEYNAVLAWQTGTPYGAIVADGMRGTIRKTERLLMMREVEVIGVLETDARVSPGYEAAQWNKPTKGLTPEVTTVPR